MSLFGSGTLSGSYSESADLWILKSFSLGIPVSISSVWEDAFAEDSLFKAHLTMKLAPAFILQDLTGTASNCLTLRVFTAHFLETEHDQLFLSNDYVPILTN